MASSLVFCVEMSVLVCLWQEMAKQLKQVSDVVIPLVAGELGESGSLQAALQQAGVPFVGAPGEAIAQAADRGRYATAHSSLYFLELKTQQTDLGTWILANRYYDDCPSLFCFL